METLTDLEKPAETYNLNCIRCGLCLSVCPTYREYLNETTSPGGRVALAGKGLEGQLELSPNPQGIERGWGATDDLTSPTFTLIHELRRRQDKAHLYHVDLYRIEREAEAWMLGLTDLMDTTASVLIEWPERAPSLLPPDRLWIKLELLDDTRRRLSFDAVDGFHLELLKEFRKSAFGI